MTKDSDAQTLAWLDQQDRMTTETVRRHGWMVQYVMGEEQTPSFAYTVGLFGLGHPELVVFGLDYESAMGLLNLLGAKVRENHDIRAGQILSFDGTDTRVRADVLPNAGDVVFRWGLSRRTWLLQALVAPAQAGRVPRVIMCLGRGCVPAEFPAPQGERVARVLRYSHGER